jgi:hypothetical protein
MKYLVYCCVFYNKDYLKLLDLLLKSMKQFSKINFDFLVITQSHFEPLVKEMGSKIGLDLKVFSLDFTTIFQAACARLFIFDYPEIQEYEKILYLDTDIIIKSDLGKILDLPINDLLYGIESGTLDSFNFGGQFFDFNKMENKSGINSGTLLFLNSETIKNLFQRMRNHIETYTNEGKQPPYCMDQPFINYHAIKDSLYDNKLLNPFVSLYEGNDTVDNYETSSVCHFSFPIGNFGHKFNRMSNFFNTILYKDNSTGSMDFIGRKYSWGNGYIRFLVNHNTSLNLLETSWGNGSYNIISALVFCVFWNNCYHMVKFNSEYTEFEAIRTEPRDFQYVKGKLIDSYLNIYGDSHALLSFKGLSMAHRNLFDFSRTMHRIGRDNHIINFHKSHNSKERVFCLVYGEVDVRAHVGKQVNLGRHHESVCQSLVDSYLKSVKSNILEYKAIIIVGISPPTSAKDHDTCKKHSYVTGGPIPFIGPDSDRVIYRNTLNTILKEECMKYGFIFFNPFDFYEREDGTLNYDLSDSCIHIGQPRHFLDEFDKLMNNLNS